MHSMRKVWRAFGKCEPSWSFLAISSRLCRRVLARSVWWHRWNWEQLMERYAKCDQWFNRLFEATPMARKMFPYDKPIPCDFEKGLEAGSQSLSTLTGPSKYIRKQNMTNDSSSRNALELGEKQRALEAFSFVYLNVCQYKLWQPKCNTLMVNLLYDIIANAVLLVFFRKPNGTTIELFQDSLKQKKRRLHLSRFTLEPWIQTQRPWTYQQRREGTVVHIW